MTADKVHHRIEIFLRVVLDLTRKPPRRLTSVDRTREEVEHHRAQRIVHRRVHLVAREVFTRRPIGDLVRGIFPNLADHDGIRVALLQLCEKRLGERRREFVDHIEPPARNALVHPVMKHTVLACDDKVHVVGIRLIDVRQRVEVPPAVVLIRVAAEMVPRVVRRFLRLIGAERAVLMLAVEIDTVAARVAEYEDDTDAALLGCRDKGAKVLNIAEHGVDLVVVSRVVVVVALRLKDGVEVDAGDTELLQIVQLLHDPAQVPAEEIIGNDLLCVRIFEIHGVIRPIRTNDSALLLHNRISRTRKAVGKDLIHDRVLKPVRRACTLVVYRDLIRRGGLCAECTDTAKHLRIVPIEIGTALRRDDEVVPDEAAVFRQINPRRIEFLLPLPVLRLERNQTLPRLVLPQAHEHLMNRLECPNADAETQPTPRFGCPDNGAEIDVL